MAKRPEVIQGIADLLGEPFVTVENHARSMGAAPGRYSTKIGRGHRDINLGCDWIAAAYLAAVRNDPKNAAVKVPELGNLAGGSRGRIVRRTALPTPRGPDENALLNPKWSEHVLTSLDWDELPFPTLFDVISGMIKHAGVYLYDKSVENCPVPGGLVIAVTLTPTPSAVVSFDLASDTAGVQAKAEFYYSTRNDQTSFLTDDHSIPLQRTAIIPFAHIMRLGRIYAHSLSAEDAKKQAETSVSSTASSKNEEADDPARSSAPSETLSYEDAWTKAHAHRKISSPNSSDPTVRVCVPSRGLTLKGRSHERASHHHAVL